MVHWKQVHLTEMFEQGRTVLEMYTLSNLTASICFKRYTIWDRK